MNGAVAIKRMPEGKCAWVIPRIFNSILAIGLEHDLCCYEQHW